MDSYSSSYGLKGEAYLNSRREYWRKEAAKDRNESELKDSDVKAKKTATKSSTNGLTGEAYLNSRREYWRNEAAKESPSCQNTISESNKTDDSNESTNYLGIIFGGIFFVLFVFILASGGGPLLVLFGLFVGALLLKCMR